MIETSWVVTEGTWELILNDVTEFKIQIEMFGNMGPPPVPPVPEICGIDNVALVPEPSTLAVLGLGALSLLRRRGQDGD